METSQVFQNEEMVEPGAVPNGQLEAMSMSSSAMILSDDVDWSWSAHTLSGESWSMITTKEDSNLENWVSASPVIIKEGWLLKRGEHLKNWRDRYFVLKSDGQLLGYRAKPMTKLEEEQPLNNFTVRACKIIFSETPRPNSLILQMDPMMARILSTNSPEERQGWTQAISWVRDYLHKANTEVMRPSPKRLTMDNFKIIKVLGKGAFGKVVLCREVPQEPSGGENPKLQQLYAMKILKKSFIKQKNEQDHVKTENRVLRNLCHPFVVGLKYAFTTEDRLCFVMEYVPGGELFEHLGRVGMFAEDRAGFYAAEITLALGYLHRCGIIYRDLKLENLILDVYGHVKIVDFGLAKDQVLGDHFQHGTMCGTPAYMAPEVIMRSDYGRSVDWWSLGIVIYEMTTGILPFNSDCNEKIYELVKKKPLRFPKSPTLSNDMKDLIARLTVKDPRGRLGSGRTDALEIMEHELFAHLNWSDLERKKILPPFKPQVSEDSTDTPYLPDEFQGLPTSLTPTSWRASQDSSKFSEFTFENVNFRTGSICSRDTRSWGVSSG